MVWGTLHQIFIYIQYAISAIGVLIILTGVLLSLQQYVKYLITGQVGNEEAINAIRLKLGHILILGLEFIVAADLISTINTPDYYTVGMVAIIVLVRTILSYSLNRELMSINKS